MATCSSSGGRGKSAAKSAGGGTVAARSTATTKKTAEEKAYDAWMSKIAAAKSYDELEKITEDAAYDDKISTKDYQKLVEAADAKYKGWHPDIYGKSTGEVKYTTSKSGKRTYTMGPSDKFLPGEVRGFANGTTINFGTDWKYVKVNADTWRVYRNGKRQADRSTDDIIYVVAT